MADEKTWYDRISDAWKSLIFRYGSEEVEYTKEEKEAIAKWHIENENWNELRKMMESYSNGTPAFSAIADAAEKGLDISMFLKDMQKPLKEIVLCYLDGGYTYRGNLKFEISRAIYNSARNGTNISVIIPDLVDIIHSKSIISSPEKELIGSAVIIHHINKGEWKEIMRYLGSNSEPVVQMADDRLNRFMTQLVISAYDNPHPALSEIKKYTDEVRKASGSRKARAKIILKFASLTQKIHDGMNTVDKDKRFPVKRQWVKLVRRQVRTNG